jgi:hypothetical protein
MCRRITCNVCGKPSFSGCGRHVEGVLADVPPAERCRCRATVPPESPKPAKPGVLRRLLGRLG